MRHTDLSAAIERAWEGRDQVTYYDTGVGSMNRAPNGAARVVQITDNVLGGALGAGFEINIEETYTFLANNWSEGDELFVFGFSRGAAQARSLCRLIGWVGGFPVKADAYYVPRLYTDYLENCGRGSGASRWEERNQRRRQSGRNLLSAIVPARVRYLGVWDTVLALGSRFRLRGRPRSEKVSFHTPAAPPDTDRPWKQAIALRIRPNTAAFRSPDRKSPTTNWSIVFDR